MKIKTIKKFNTLFASILFVASALVGGVFLWSTWENEEFDGKFFAGKIGMIDVEDGDSKDESSGENVLEDSSVALDEDAGTEEDFEEAGDADGAEEELEQIDEIEEELDIQKDSNFSFVVIGDSESYKQPGGHNKELKEVLKSAKGTNPDFALFTGDIISASADSLAGNRDRMFGAKNLIENYFERYYIAFGNHDVECGKECAHFWQEILFDFTPQSSAEDKLYYSFDYENTHFVLLSSDYPLKHSIDRAQLAWLERDLESSSSDNIIVLQHVSPVAFFAESSEKCHDMSCDPRVKERLFELYKKYGVDCVVSGHEHAFDHKVIDGIDYVISGNTGNRPRYKGVIEGDIYSHFTIDNEKIVLKAINTKGKLIKEINVK